MNSKDFIIIAHRGESYDAPENTMASVNLAWERNDDAVEIDIRLSKDNKIIVIHDKNTFRTSAENFNVKEKNYSFLKKLDVGKHKKNRYAGEEIPLLKNIIENMPEGKLLFVEIKSGENTAGILKSFCEKKDVNPVYVKFISFNRQLLDQLKKLLPHFEMYWIVDDKIPVFKKNLNTIIKYCKSSNLNGVDFDEKMISSKSVIDKIHEAGLKIYCWTVNNPERARQLMNWNIDGITSDRAHWLSGQIK